MRRMKRPAVAPVAAVALAIVVGCTGTARTEASGAPAAEADQAVVVTRSQGDFKPTCSPRAIGRRLRGLSEALRAVDVDALQRYWGPGFGWFRVNLRSGGFAAETYEDGVAALEQRGGLQLRFRNVKLSGRSGDATFDANYRKPGGAKKDLAGKVGLSCRTPTMKVLTSFSWARGEIARCPKPRRDPPPGAMIVCSRRAG